MNETYQDLEKTPKPENTFGMELVGINFNPSGDPTVAEVKQMFADFIDTVFEDDVVFNDSYEIIPEESLRQFYRDYAIMKVMEAQMWTIKFLTAKPKNNE